MEFLLFFHRSFSGSPFSFLWDGEVVGESLCAEHNFKFCPGEMDESADPLVFKDVQTLPLEMIRFGSFMVI